MKICVLSDSHERAPTLAVAVAEAKKAGAEAIIHCRDVIGANTLRPLLKLAPSRGLARPPHGCSQT